MQKRTGFTIEAKDAYLKILKDIDSDTSSTEPYLIRLKSKILIKLARCYLKLLNPFESRRTLIQAKPLVDKNDTKIHIRYREAKCEYWISMGVLKKLAKNTEKLFLLVKDLKINHKMNYYYYCMFRYS